MRGPSVGRDAKIKLFSFFRTRKIGEGEQFLMFRSILKGADMDLSGLLVRRRNHRVVGNARGLEAISLNGVLDERVDGLGVVVAHILIREGSSVAEHSGPHDVGDVAVLELRDLFEFLSVLRPIRNVVGGGDFLEEVMGLSEKVRKLIDQVVVFVAGHRKKSLQLIVEYGFALGGGSRVVILGGFAKKLLKAHVASQLVPIDMFEIQNRRRSLGIGLAFDPINGLDERVRHFFEFRFDRLILNSDRFELGFRDSHLRQETFAQRFAIQSLIQMKVFVFKKEARGLRRFERRISLRERHGSIIDEFALCSEVGLVDEIALENPFRVCLAQRLSGFFDLTTGLIETAHRRANDLGKRNFFSVGVANRSSGVKNREHAVAAAGKFGVGDSAVDRFLDGFFGRGGSVLVALKNVRGRAGRSVAGVTRAGFSESLDVGPDSRLDFDVARPARSAESVVFDEDERVGSAVAGGGRIGNDLRALFDLVSRSSSRPPDRIREVPLVRAARGYPSHPRCSGPSRSVGRHSPVAIRSR